MTNSINGIGGITPASIGVTQGSGTQKNSTDFIDVLNEALGAVEQTELADRASNIEMLTGEGGTMHGTLLEAEKADIALRLTLEVRNKVVEAYKEVMQMQV